MILWLDAIQVQIKLGAFHIRKLSKFTYFDKSMILQSNFIVLNEWKGHFG